MAHPHHVGIGSVSASRTCTDTVAGVHQYVVCGFSLAAGLGPGSSVRSDTFAVAGVTWQLECFPAGIDAENKDFVALVIHAFGPPNVINSVRILHSIAMLDQSGGGEHIIFGRSREEGPDCLGKSQYLAVYPRFAKRSVLLENGGAYLRNDMLVIRCTVEAVRSWTSRIASVGSGTYEPGLQPSRLALLGAGAGAVIGEWANYDGRHEQDYKGPGYPFETNRDAWPASSWKVNGGYRRYGHETNRDSSWPASSWQVSDTRF